MMCGRRVLDVIEVDWRGQASLELAGRDMG